MSDSYQRMSGLALSFPGLVGAPGTLPFDAEALDAWAAAGGIGNGSQHAARFVLSVWNYRAERAAGPFNAVHALGVWDADHRAAFLAWAQDPWWP
jgi:hypothetical protein